MGRPELRALSRLLGVTDAYVPAGERAPRLTTDAARVALLAAMGVDGSTERAAARARARLAAEAARRTVEPVRVAGAAEAGRVPVHAPQGAPRILDWEVELRLEDGRVRRAAGRRPFRPGMATRLAIGFAPPCGYHELTVRLAGGPASTEARQQLAVTPARCATVGTVLGSHRVFGIGVNLYSVRGRRDSGVGDVATLRDLVRWAAEHEGAFVGVNPLQAQRIRDGDVSPYAPSSRIFRSAVYVDCAAVPELRDDPEARGPMARGGAAGPTTHVDYAGALARKERLLRRAYRRLARSSPARRRAFERFVRDGGRVLEDYATFEALREHLRDRGLHHWSWRTWPVDLRNPRSPAVARFRARHRDDVSFRCFVQFELARQLEGVQRAGRRSGMPVGLYHDLPVGVSGDGADAWAWGDVFADGASIGAPPDDFQPDGQDWGLPPVVPHRLAQGGFRYWFEVVRAAFRAAGAVRIDHAMGLARQYWVTGSGTSRHGAYVAQPFAALMGIVALESVRAGALVVGEDLGTVPRGFRRRMARFGALSMRILYFERTTAGGYRASADYPAQALVAADTHDLASLPAFWSGSDLALRQRLGVGNGSAGAARRDREREALCRRLAREGCLPAGADPSVEQVVLAVHRHLAATPSALFAVSLDDLAGETEPVNLPGVPGSVYPSWTRRMSRPLDEITADPAVQRILAAITRLRRRPPATPGARAEPGRRDRSRAAARPRRASR